MGTKRKAVKGTVSLQTLTNRRRFKYRNQKKVYFLTLPRIPSPLEEHVRKIIQVDIIQGTHDDSQLKYKNLLKNGNHPPVIQFAESNQEKYQCKFILQNPIKLTQPFRCKLT